MTRLATLASLTALLIIALSPFTTPEIASSSQPTFPVAILVGYHDLETSGENADLDVVGNYVAVGHERLGVRIIDASDKSNPKLVGKYRSPLSGTLTDPRLTDTDADGKPDIMIVNLQLGHGSGGIEIVDIRNPSNPLRISSADNITTHNIAVTGSGTADRSDDYVYLATSHPDAGFSDMPPLPKGAQQLRIYSIKDPQKPVKVGGWTANYNARPGEFVTLHDICVKDDKAYLSYWDAGLYILDVSDPANPKEIGWLDYSPPDDGNTHNAISTPSGDVVFIGDEVGFLPGETGIGGVRAVDASKLPNLTQVAHYKPELPKFETKGMILSGTKAPESIPIGGSLPDGRASYTAHNFDLSHDGTILFATFYNGGLHMLDVSNPSKPRLMQIFYPLRLFESQDPIAPAFWGAIYQNGYLYVADINNGLWILQIVDVQKEAPKTLPSKFGIEIPNIRGKLQLWTTGYFPKYRSEMNGNGDISFDLRSGHFKVEVEGLPKLKIGSYETYMTFETAEGIQDNLSLGNFNVAENGKTVREFQINQNLIRSGRYFNAFSIYRMPTSAPHQNLLTVKDAVQVLVANGDMSGLIPKREKPPSIRDFGLLSRPIPENIGIDADGIKGKIPLVVKETFNPSGFGSGTVAFDLAQGAIELEVVDLPHLTSGTYEAYLAKFDPNGKPNSSGFVDFMSIGAFNAVKDDGIPKSDTIKHLFYNGSDLTPRGFNLLLVYSQNTAGIHATPEAENYDDILGNNPAILAANLTGKDGSSTFSLKRTISVKGKLTASLGQVKSWALLQNFPNPFNAETWIPFRLLDDAPVIVEISNWRASVIRKVKLSLLPAGDYSTKSKAAYWDGKNEYGEDVASGVYFYTIRAGNFSATKKMIVVK